MTEARALPAVPDSVRYATACYLSAVLLFGMMDTLIKLLSAEYPVPQLMFVRSLVALLIVGGWAVARDGNVASLRTRRSLGHVWRAFAGLISMGCFFYAFKHLPLAEVYVLSFAGPLFITALSVPLLGETVGWRRWAAVLVGFAGVVIMAGPSSSGAPLLPVLVGLTAAFFYALAVLAVRGLARTETSTSTVVYLLLTTTVVSGVLTIPVWETPDARGLGLMALVGTLGAAAQVLLTQAFRRAPPATVAPFEYTGMIWATLFGFLVFGEVPTPAVLAGALVIIGSGLYILHRETMRR
ncbi:DMT family transporter [Azospirillum thermophilum]|uniref:EamA/RhaT family transporter n=1 Tax=Azospirillum thermophilum TaxID=2202148 RepID=A0A2S2D068_9PROT|nr:DMT family transporter [Azospirillum thermophilum]AWK90146.1 EamA/RhaT family transporter [Azospirillum thermophilum]